LKNASMTVNITLMKRIVSALAIFLIVLSCTFASDSYMGGSLALGYGFSYSKLSYAGIKEDGAIHTFTVDPTAKFGHFFGALGFEYYLKCNTMFLKFDDEWDYDSDTYDYDTNIDTGIYAAYRRPLTEKTGYILSAGPSFDYFESSVDGRKEKIFFLKVGASAKMYRRIFAHLVLFYGLDVSAPIWSDVEVKVGGTEQTSTIEVYGVHISPFIGAAFNY